VHKYRYKHKFDINFELALNQLNNADRIVLFVQFNTMAVSGVCGAKLIAIPRRPVISAARTANTLFMLKIMN
jgi:hypothetical protein